MLRKAALILSAFSLAVGCTPPPAQPPQQEQQGTASASISIQASDITPPEAGSTQERHLSALSGPSAQAFSYLDVSSIRIDVKEKATGNILYINFDLSLFEGAWTGTLPFLPKGMALTFTARAFNAGGTLLFNGTVDQTLSFDGEKIIFTLSPANDKQTIKLPRIRKISVPSALGSDQSGNVSFAVEATTGETLTYSITAATGGGSFYPVSGAITLTATTGTFVSQYVSPSVTTEKEFEHTVKVTNEAGHSVSTTFKTKVKPTGTTDGVKDNTVSVFFSPVINSISAQRVLGTGNVIFGASVADDGDLSTLAYTWSFTATTGTTFDPMPAFSGTTNPATLQNYTPLVQGTVELTVKDTNKGVTTLYYKLTPDQFPDNPIIEGDTTGLNTIRAGEFHTCALMSNGTVRCWGRGNYGQLGYGNSLTVGSTSTTLPYTAGNVPLMGVATKLAVGANHTCALLNTGFVRCWGYNAHGQLGLNTTQNVGDAEALSNFGYVNLGGITTTIAAGYNHTCALLNTGNVRCWGLNNYGQLGYGHTLNVGDNEQPSKYGDVQLGGPVKDIIAGGNHTCALMETGKVRCWGLNNYGQLGYGNTTWIGDTEHPNAVSEVALAGNAVQLSAGEEHTCALMENGFVRCWGLNAAGQLGYGNTTTLTSSGGDVATGSKVLQVSAGNDHTCALLSTGAIKCWGYGLYGQLGYASTGNLTSPGANVDLSGATAYRITTGLNHTCALLSTGAARCWGINNYGQLGYGNTSPLGDNEQPSTAGDIKVMAP
ncbi:MAG TPA: RTX toxin [Archangium sp.]|uniref:RCC1 domain-containing protein n=1 Tax=Archangium sp. TaxID=1872627 RepID=UPI002E35CC90|nr:RTX toxin [Archangium sp.]HEX5749434.1 RTX toxin [Archangium sp.]